MPTQTVTPVRGYAHCVVPRCPGTYEQEVDALKVTTSWSFIERGGDIPGEENSQDAARFADEADAVCEHCDGHREVSLSPRPQYQPLSGHDPMGLLGMPQYDPNKVNAPNDQQAAEIEALRTQLEEQRKLIEQALGQKKDEE
jgi:hypothetical protein